MLIIFIVVLMKISSNLSRNINFNALIYELMKIKSYVNHEIVFKILFN